MNEDITTFLSDSLIAVKLEVDKDTIRNVKYTSDTPEPTAAVFPNFDTYEAMLQDDTQISHSRNFPKYSRCPYLGLRKPFTSEIPKNSTLPKCRPRLITASDCTDVVNHFGQYGTMKAGQCNHKNSIKICSVSKLGQKYKREDIQISCDASACPGKQISLGLFNETVGEVTWSSVKHIVDLSKILRNHITSSAFAPGFALLKCKGGREIQVLSFPKILDRISKEQSESKRRVNINIVLEDSLSRAHFYRTLLKTASTFRDIIYNQSIPATLLEFEKVQSYAASTYSNVQRLFAAQKFWNTELNCDQRKKEFLVNNANYSCTYGVDELFGHYKKAGYSTLFQEDSCWIDDRGSLLDAREFLGPTSKKNWQKRWKNYAAFVKKSGRIKVIDDYGISTLSCDVYRQYNATNPFNSNIVPNACFAGRPYGSFFLEYVKTYTQHNDIAAQPFIAYTHLLTSHCADGRRIVNDDENLALLFRHAGHLRNTVTIFASDHGAKASTFAGYTTQGRQEVFQPLLFIIIPHSVRKKLGPKVMDALVVNQNRLVGVEDLHHALLSILDASEESVSSTTNPNINALNKKTEVEMISTRLGGLFKPIALDRTCEQMNLRPEVLCLCDGMDKTVPNDFQTLQWAGEFALGTINNMIQQQYRTGLRSNLASGLHGYGTCQRYTGEGIMQARHKIAGLEQKFFFTLAVKPLDKKSLEIFDVVVSFPMKKHMNGEIMTLENVIRVSPYNNYEQCKDKGVEPKLCTCHPEEKNNTLWRNELYSKTTSQMSFKVKPQSQTLDHPCLFLISRHRKLRVSKRRWRKHIQTYEAINACSNVTYYIFFHSARALNARVSLQYGTSVTLHPQTVTFLLTAKISRRLKYAYFIPRFKFKKSRSRSDKK